MSWKTISFQTRPYVLLCCLFVSEEDVLFQVLWNNFQKQTVLICNTYKLEYFGEHIYSSQMYSLIVQRYIYIRSNIYTNWCLLPVLMSQSILDNCLYANIKIGILFRFHIVDISEIYKKVSKYNGGIWMLNVTREATLFKGSFYWE